MGTLHVRDIIILISKGFPKALGHLEMIFFFIVCSYQKLLEF